MADVRVFLKVQGVPGESAAPGHQGWIDVVAHSFLKEDVQRFGSSSNPKDREDKLTVTLKRGKHSPVLHQANASGKHFASLQLDVKVGTRVHHYRLNDVTVSGFREQGPDGGDPHPADYVIFAAVDDFKTTGSPDAIPGPSKLADSGKSPAAPSGGSTGLKDAVLHIRVVDEKGKERVPKGNDKVKIRAFPGKNEVLKYEAANGFVYQITGGQGTLNVSVQYDGFEEVKQDFLFDAPAKAPTLKAFWPGNDTDPSGRGRRDGYLLACMNLTRTAGGIDDARSPKVFNLTVTLHRTRLGVFVIGADYWEGPSGPRPIRKNLSFETYSLTYMQHLTATDRLNLSSAVDWLNCQRGRVERWERVRGAGWKRHYVMEQHTPAPAWPRPADFLEWDKLMRATPAEAKKYIGATNIYKYLSGLGGRIPGAVANFSVVSHGWAGGAILYNTRTWADHRVERFAGDLDFRLHQDFVAPNVGAWASMPKAFATDATIHIWGCLATDLLTNMVSFLLNNSRGGAERFVSKAEGLNIDRPTVVKFLRDAIADNTYMSRLARFTGTRTFGSVPGFGGDTAQYDSIPTIPANLKRAVSGKAMHVPVITERQNIRKLFESAELGGQRFDEFGYMLYKP